MVPELGDRGNERLINLIFIITFLAQQKSYFANTLTHLPFFHPLQQYNIDLIQRPRPSSVSLVKHLFTSQL